MLIFFGMGFLNNRKLHFLLFKKQTLHKKMQAIFRVDKSYAS